MKKFILSTLTAFATFFSTSAQASLILLSDDDNTENSGGLMAYSISENGRWICGTTPVIFAFTADLETGDIKYYEPYDDYGSEFRGISNNGIAVGFNGSYGAFDTTTNNYIVLETPDGLVPIGNGITPDGSTICGVVVENEWFTYPVVWDISGTYTLLPTPTSEELGFNTNGCYAMHISEDGNTIVGYIQDDMAYYPLILWNRDSEGKWNYDISYTKEYFNPGNGTQQFTMFYPTGFSLNGKYVGLSLRNATDKTTCLGILNLETNKIVTAKADGSFPRATYNVSGISDDGIAVGFINYGLGTGSHASFMYWYGEDEAQTFDTTFLNDEFDVIRNNPYTTATTISRDGKLIIGFSQNPTTTNFFSFIIEMESGAINTITADGKNTEIVARYDIYGRPLSAPAHGINILKMADGTAKKVFVK